MLLTHCPSSTCPWCLPRFFPLRSDGIPGGPHPVFTSRWSFWPSDSPAVPIYIDLITSRRHIRDPTICGYLRTAYSPLPQAACTSWLAFRNSRTELPTTSRRLHPTVHPLVIRGSIATVTRQDKRKMRLGHPFLPGSQDAGRAKRSAQDHDLSIPPTVQQSNRRTAPLPLPLPAGIRKAVNAEE